MGTGGIIYDHPKCNKIGYVLQHRLVMEDVLGDPGEQRTGSPQKQGEDGQTARKTLNSWHLGRNTSPCISQQETSERQTIPLTEDQVREALQGKTTLEAAKLLGVNHDTLRLRFGGLLKKRRARCRSGRSEPRLNVSDGRRPIRL